MDFICGCGRKQREHTSLKTFTEKNVEEIGWRKIDGEWVCPLCCNNKAALNNMDNIHDLSCECCADGMEAREKRERECIERDGWFSHIIQYAPGYPYDFNMHTHGLKENFDHPDLQICLPIDYKIAYAFVVHFIEQIKKGKKYIAGTPFVDNDVFANDHPIQMAWAKEGNRDVLRIILSDQYKSLDRETMELHEQWEGTFEKD